MLGYVYDFGDLWVHRITLDKVIARPRVPLPRCLAAACLPARRLRRPLGIRDRS